MPEKGRLARTERSGSDGLATSIETKRIKGSVFGKKEAEPLSIPERTPPEVARVAREILEQNPFLEAPQLHAVIRLAGYRIAYEKAFAQMLEIGEYVERNEDTGRTQPSGHLAAVTRIESQIQKLERDLAINFVARASTVDRANQRPAKDPTTKIGKVQRKIA